MTAQREKPKIPRGRRGKKIDSDETSQATTDEFQREGLGVAAKE